MKVNKLFRTCTHTLEDIDQKSLAGVYLDIVQKITRGHCSKITRGHCSKNHSRTLFKKSLEDIVQKSLEDIVNHSNCSKNHSRTLFKKSLVDIVQEITRGHWSMYSLFDIDQYTKSNMILKLNFSVKILMWNFQNLINLKLFNYKIILKFIKSVVSWDFYCKLLLINTQLLLSWLVQLDSTCPSETIVLLINIINSFLVFETILSA